MVYGLIGNTGQRGEGVYVTDTLASTQANITLKSADVPYFLVQAT